MTPQGSRYPPCRNTLLIPVRLSTGRASLGGQVLRTAQPAPQATILAPLADAPHSTARLASGCVRPSCTRAPASTPRGSRINFVPTVRCYFRYEYRLRIDHKVYTGAAPCRSLLLRVFKEPSDPGLDLMTEYNTPVHPGLEDGDSQAGSKGHAA